MEEQIETGDVQEGIERVESALESGWGRYLALSTALIAVVAALASLVSGNFANRALLEKNDALLFQIKASDTWSEYQAKGIKALVVEACPAPAGHTAAGEVERYRAEQATFKNAAQKLESNVEESNRRSEQFLEKHHTVALSVTTFQIAIALSAMSALLRRRTFWALSLVMALAGIGFLAAGLS